jgi:hypothetical protein
MSSDQSRQYGFMAWMAFGGMPILILGSYVLNHLLFPITKRALTAPSPAASVSTFASAALSTSSSYTGAPTREEANISLFDMILGDEIDVSDYDRSASAILSTATPTSEQFKLPFGVRIDPFHIVFSETGMNKCVFFNEKNTPSKTDWRIEVSMELEESGYPVHMSYIYVMNEMYKPTIYIDSKVADSPEKYFDRIPRSHNIGNAPKPHLLPEVVTVKPSTLVEQHTGEDKENTFKAVSLFGACKEILRQSQPDSPQPDLTVPGAPDRDFAATLVSQFPRSSPGAIAQRGPSLSRRQVRSPASQRLAR